MNNNEGWPPLTGDSNWGEPPAPPNPPTPESADKAAAPTAENIPADSVPASTTGVPASTPASTDGAAEMPADRPDGTSAETPADSEINTSLPATPTENEENTSSDSAAPQPILAIPPVKKEKIPKHPGWAALLAMTIVAALLGGVLGVGVMTWRYSGTRPVSAAEGEPTVEPVVDSKATTPDWQAVAKAVGPATVAIEAQKGESGAAGSGVVIDKEGHILTNHHVISGAEKLQVTFSDGRLYAAEVAGADAATDLAVITIKNPPKDITVAALGDSSKVTVGEPVAAIGNPLGLASTMTTGIVSALDRPVQTVSTEGITDGEAARVVTNAIQLDAAVNPGNSGGPVFDASGRVIGIASSIATTSRGANSQGGGSIGLGFAIPINLAKHISQQLIEKGVAEHAYLGVVIRNGIAEYSGVSRVGAQIEQIEPGTPAAKGKLQKGDVVVAFNGRNVVSAVSLTGFVRQRQSGDQVTLTIERNGELQELDITLATKVDKE